MTTTTTTGSAATASPQAVAEGVDELLLVPPVDDSPLALSTLRFDAGATYAFSSGDADGFLFVVEGAGRADDDDSGSREVKTGTSLRVSAGTTLALTADVSDLVIVWAQAGPQCDRHAPLGDDARTTEVDQSAGAAATGKRSFQVLFDAGNGSTRATLFVGYVPPGRAPWHFHQYDEIVFICRGTGRLLLTGQEAEVGDGSAFRLRPREVHILENLGDDDLILLGLFTPAGSPAAAYLAESPEA